LHDFLVICVSKKYLVKGTFDTQYVIQHEKNVNGNYCTGSLVICVSKKYIVRDCYLREPTGLLDLF
jgi:hypothetical protein